MSIIGIPQKTPLHNSHVKLNAKIVDFAGWLLPVQYTSITKENLHTREFNSIFDICHMGEFLIEGASAQDDLSRLLTTDIKSMKPGICRYGFLLNKDGNFIDDSILYKHSNQNFMLVVNASRIDTDLEWIKAGISTGSIIKDISAKTAKIDLQGPLAVKTAKASFPGYNFGALKRFHFDEFSYKNISITVSATGYTGEIGFEFFMPSENAEEIWDILLKNDTVKPAGLGARDSLRLEKGYSLYGHDIDENINPYEANLSRFIDSSRDFIGADKLRELSDEKIKCKLVPFICEGRRSARDGYKVYADGEESGYVTSGTYSPGLQRGIGLCLIKKEHSFEGNSLICRNGNIEINAAVCSLPFI